MDLKQRLADASIWLYALGYFACYAPYSATAKALSSGLVHDQVRPISGYEMLPLSVFVSVVGMVLTISALGWWKHATQLRVGPLSLPVPTRWTFLSGLCTAAIVATTTLAYTFDGVSIVFMMLLMRGGVLVIAPTIDLLTGRKVRWFSGLALALSLLALVVAFAERGGFAITVVAAVDVAIYLASYFVRLRFMSRLAKSSDQDATRRYFVEEQLVGTPAVLVFLGAVALLGGDGAFASQVRAGFLDLASHPAPVVLATALVGLLSQGTGLFGGLILLDRREHTFCVPVNRSSSVLAGLVASYALYFLLGQSPPAQGELWGAALVLAAILSLSLPPLLSRVAGPAAVK